MSNFLIIGGSSDIGFEVAKKLSENHHQVHLTGRKEGHVSRLANQLNAPYSFLDAVNFEAVSETMQVVKQQLGPIHGVVNCAGSFFLKSAHLTTQTDFDTVIQTNLSTAFAVVHAAGKIMTETGGSVVLISSSAALIGLSNHECIAAAKAGIIGLALSAAATYAGNNLRFNVVAPGLIETKLTHTLTENSIMKNLSEKMHPLGRLGKAQDVASAIVFLLDPENSWITGSVLTVDGGLSHIKPKVKI